MSNSADFELRLRTAKLQSPAQAASQAIRQVRQSFIDLDRDGTRAMRQLERSVDQQAAASARAEREQANARSAAARRQIQDYRLVQNLKRRSEREHGREAAAQVRAAQQRARGEARAAAEVIKVRQREDRHAARMSSLASGRARSDAAFQAHRKVLDGGMAAELAGSMRGGGGGLSGLASLGSLGAAAGPIAAVAVAIAAVAAAAAAAAVAVGRLAMSFAGSAIEGMKFAQNAELAIGNLVPKGESARKVFDEVRTEAARLGLDVKETVGSFQGLLAAQFEVGKARELIRMGSDLKGIGANAEQVGRALHAITQIKSKGRLMGEEMMQLQEAKVSSELVYAALEENLGKSRAEIIKLQEAGKIDSKTGIEAILAAVRKKTNTSYAGELGEKVADSTLDGLEGQLRGRMENTWTAIGRAMEPIVQPIASRISKALLAGFDNPRIKAAGQRLLGHFERFGGWVMEHMPQIESVIGAAFDGVGKAIEGVNSAIEFFQEHSTVTKAILIGMGASLAANAVVFGVLAAAATATVRTIVAVGAAVAGAISVVSSLADAVSQAAPRFMQAGAQLVDGFIAGITSRAQAAIDVVRNLASSVASVFTGPQGIDAHSPSRLFRGFGEDTTAGYVAGIKSSRSEVGAAIAQVVPFAANDNAIASRAPAAAAPIAPFVAQSAPGALQAQAGGGSKTINLGGITLNNTFHGQQNAETLSADLSEQVERQIKRVIGGI